MDNSDHYKYMPHPQGTPEPERLDPVEIEEIIEEEVTEMEEQAAAPAATEATIEASEIKPEKNKDGETFFRMMGEGVLRFFYDFFNPLLLPTYATLLIFELSILAIIAPGATAAYTLTVFGITCLLPLVALIVLKGLKAIPSFNLPTRKSRIYIYLIELLAFGAVTIFFVVRGAAPWLWTIYLGATATVFANFIINFWMRVSCHCSAVAGLMAVLIAIINDGMPHHTLGWWAVGTAAVAGALGTGAIILGRHTVWEVICGYATGFLGIILFIQLH